MAETDGGVERRHSYIAETIEFTNVVNYALIEIYRKRARLSYTGFRDELVARLGEYAAAVEALYNYIEPLFPKRVAEAGRLIESARRTILQYSIDRYSASPLEAIDKLDHAVKAMIEVLNNEGLLFREKSVRVGTIGASISH